jgi:predicted amidohydrolase YtcJ
MIADVLFVNGDFVTLDDAQPRTDALAVAGGRIVATGPEAAGVPSARVVDLHGACVVPGFHDAHAHTLGFGLSLSELRLTSPPFCDLGELYAAIGARAGQQAPGTWIIAGGYDQNKIGGLHPSRWELDRVAGDHPVWLTHTSGHMCVVNSPVLAAIDMFRRPELASLVERDISGEPTGLLLEEAQSLVRDLLPPLGVDLMAAAIGAAHAQYLREGLTSCQEAGIGSGLAGYGPEEPASYRLARARGLLTIRTTLMLEVGYLDSAPPEERAAQPWYSDDWLRLGPVKLFADGSLVGRTAAMSEDFVGDRGNCGQLQMSEEQLSSTIRRVHAAGWQLATHAIGDRAVEVVLDSYERALHEHPRFDHRHRIEHCGVASPEQVRRIAALGVVPVPQGRFVGELGEAMARVLGPERTPWCYRLRSFLDAGVVVPGSSDRPVVVGRPLLGIHDMVNRQTELGQPFVPEEAVTPLQALRAYTLGSAYATFLEQDRGSLEVGKRADFAVLSEDLTRCRPDQIRDIRVDATIVGGLLAYDDAGFGAR